MQRTGTDYYGIRYQLIKAVIIGCGIVSKNVIMMTDVKGEGMKKQRASLLIVTLISALFFSGCGTSMYELTDSEEEIIVHYAAYAVAKHNIFQKDGAKVVDAGLYEAESEEPETEIPDTEDTEAETETGQSSLPQGTDGQSTEHIPDGEAISLADAIGQSGILNVTYQGCSVADNYQEGNYYSVQADAGNTYVIMQFTMQNQTSASVEVDTLELNPTFQACFNGADWVQEEVTLLLNSLSTYEGIIEAGGQADVVLLFQIPQEQAEQLSDISLSVLLNGTTSPVNL